MCAHTHAYMHTLICNISIYVCRCTLISITFQYYPYIRSIVFESWSNSHYRPAIKHDNGTSSIIDHKWRFEFESHRYPMD